MSNKEPANQMHKRSSIHSRLHQEEIPQLTNSPLIEDSISDLEQIMSILQDLKPEFIYIYCPKTAGKSPLSLSDLRKSPVKFKKQRTSNSSVISTLVTHARKLTRSINPRINRPLADVKIFKEPPKSYLTPINNHSSFHFNISSNKSYDQNPISNNTSAIVGIIKEPPKSHLTVVLNNHKSSSFNILSNNSNDQTPPSNNASADVEIFKEPPDSHLTQALNNHNSSSFNKPSNDLYGRNPPQSTQHNQAQPKFPTPHKGYLDSGSTHHVIPDLNLPYFDSESTHHVIPDISHSSYTPYQGFEHPPTEMQIFVRDMIGKTYTIQVKPTEKVKILKMEIHKKSGIESDYQRLIYGGKQLEDARIIADYGIIKASTIVLVLRFRGA